MFVHETTGNAPEKVDNSNNNSLQEPAGNIDDFDLQYDSEFDFEDQQLDVYDKEAGQSSGGNSWREKRRLLNKEQKICVIINYYYYQIIIVG